MNKEQVENYITELESMFELSELEEHSRNILKVGIYIKQLQQENERLKEIENKLNFIKNRVKQGMSQENINKCAIKLINNYLKEN